MKVYGGKDSPYVCAAVPDGYNSWSFFDKLLNDYHIVVTPGVGFGDAGEGYIRLTAFNTLENTQKAIKRLIDNPF